MVIMILFAIWIWLIYLILPAVVDSSLMDFNSSNTDWMSRLPPSLRKYHLFELAIPGSHNSGSYSLQPDKYNYQERDKFTKYFKKAFNSTQESPVIGDIMYKWSKTQELNITEQLNLGVRYLDLRITVDPQLNSFIVHRLLGTNLSDVLQQVNDFIENNPKEIIILDFNHVYFDQHSTDLMAKNAINYLVTLHFQKKLCPVSMVFYAKLKDYWKRRCQILVFYGTANIRYNPRRRHPTKGLILSPFDEKAFTQKTTWIKFLNTNYDRGRPYGKLYITQGIMEPHWMAIVAAGISQNSTLKNWVSDDASSKIVKWLRQKHNGRDGVNVVIADFVEGHDFVETVLALNNNSVTPSLHSMVKLHLVCLCIFSILL